MALISPSICFRRASERMHENGLEWLFRLLVEPRRLWKRYLVTIPSAIWSILLEIVHLKENPMAGQVDLSWPLETVSVTSPLQP
jgi:hypothetical protein